MEKQKSHTSQSKASFNKSVTGPVSVIHPLVSRASVEPQKEKSHLLADFQPSTLSVDVDCFFLSVITFVACFVCPCLHWA